MVVRKHTYNHLMMLSIICFNSGAIFGPLRLKPKNRDQYRRYYLPWAIETGRNIKPLLNIYWEKRWHQDLDELRAELNIKKLSIPPTA